MTANCAATRSPRPEPPAGSADRQLRSLGAIVIVGVLLGSGLVLALGGLGAELRSSSRGSSGGAGGDAIGADLLAAAHASLRAGHGPKWTQESPSAAPSARQSYAMAYDAKDGYVVLFGGAYTSGVFGDTWIFQGGNWTQLSPARSPSARYGASMVWDAHDGYVVLFGGDTSTSSGAALNDTWKFLHGTWTQLHPPVSPPARFWAGAAYDARDSYVVLFGGVGCTAPTTCTDLNDTWDFLSGVWINVTRPIAPSARAEPNLVYDAADRYVLLYGGGGLNDTWTFVNGVWTELPLSTAPSDQGTYSSMAYDPSTGYVVLFGGQPLRCPGCMNPDPSVNFTWKYVGGTWSNITRTVGPSPRSEAALVYDPSAKALVLFGGSYYAYFTGANSLYSDTWEFT